MTKRPDPKQAEEAQAAASVPEETLAKSTLDALLQAKPDALVKANPEAELRKRTERISSGWLHAPAQLEFLAAADERLSRIANAMGMTTKKVQFLQAELIAGTKIVIIKPAPETDRTAYPVKRYEGKSGFHVNLWPLLGEAGLAVDSGYKERYDINYIPKESALAPGLVIDLGQVKERRKEGNAGGMKENA